MMGVELRLPSFLLQFLIDKLINQDSVQINNHLLVGGGA
jgi:hypothetical protein